MNNITKSLILVGTFAVSSFSQLVFSAASENSSTTNGDGSITVTQKIDDNSTSPHYSAPNNNKYGLANCQRQ